jgi:hypothetical protein
MVRCIYCGHLNGWSSKAIVPCTHCGRPQVMPDEQTARVTGVLEGLTPPYLWVLRQDEVVLLLDGLESLMESFSQMLAGGNLNEEVYNALVGSYTYTKMTRTRLRQLAPDLPKEEADVV